MRIVVHVYIRQITTGNGFENLQILLVALLPTQFDQINLPYLAQMFAVTVKRAEPPRRLYDLVVVAAAVCTGRFAVYVGGIIV